METTDKNLMERYRQGNLRSKTIYKAEDQSVIRMTYYLNGTLESLTTERYGKKEGKAYRFHPNGVVSELAEYEGGELNGRLCRFDERSILTEIRGFEDGKCYGISLGGNDLEEIRMANEFRHAQSMDTVRQLTSADRIYRDIHPGSLATEGKHIPDGLYIYNLSAPKGRTVTVIEHYRNGLRNGAHHQFVDGKPVYRCHYRDNVKDGVAIRWNLTPTGGVSLKSYTVFVAGKADGLAVHQVKDYFTTAHFRDGEVDEHGWRKWSKEGRLLNRKPTRIIHQGRSAKRPDTRNQICIR